jgi:Ser/Thr protein kinase RdoA (MazF antagonist)
MDGLKTNCFPAQGSILSAEAILKSVLPHYPVTPPFCRCQFFKAHINDIYRAGSGESTYYLRVSRSGWRTRKELLAEIAFVKDLNRSGIPAALPVKAADGTYLRSIRAPEGLRWAVLFTEAAGTPLDIADHRHNSQFGSLLGRIHRLADQWPMDFHRHHLDVPHLLRRPSRLISRYYRQRQQDCRFLREITGELERKIGSLPVESPAYGICHGDYQSDNVHFDSLGRPTLFDFDLCGHGWRAYDIAVFAWKILLSREVTTGKVDWLESFSAFMNGYQQERALSQAEFAVLDVFVLARIIWSLGIAVSRSVYTGCRVLDDELLDHHLRLIRSLIEKFKIL